MATTATKPAPVGTLSPAGQFLRGSLDWAATKLAINWFDRVGVVALGADRCAEIRLDAPYTIGSYNAVEVSVISKTNGQVASHRFHFDDYLDHTRNRSDSMLGWVPNGQSWYFGVIDHCGWEWYVCVPRTTRELTTAIEQYIALYR